MTSEPRELALGDEASAEQLDPAPDHPGSLTRSTEGVVPLLRG